MWVEDSVFRLEGEERAAYAPPDVAAIAEYVQEAPLFGTTADLLGDALAKARLATSVLRECLE